MTLCLSRARDARREVTMLDLFYIGLCVVFFVLMWAFARASERF